MQPVPVPRASGSWQKRHNSRSPLLWAAAVYCGGLVAGRYLWRPFSWWLIAAVVFAASAAYLRRRRPLIGFVVSCSAFFLVASLSSQIRPPAGALKTGVGALSNGQQLVVTGHVIHEGDLRERGKEEVQQKLDIETEQIETEDQVLSLRAGVRLSVYSHPRGTEDAAHVFRYGERLRFSTKLSRPRNFHNPGSFDYEGYLAQSRIVALGSTKVEDVELLPGFVGSRVELWRAEIYRNTLDRIQHLWTGQDAALMEAMLVGDNAFVGRGLLTDFQRTGTYHVLVISGLKVSILALVTFWLLRKLRVRVLASSVVTALLTVAYAWLTDIGTPVWRAALMLIIYFCAKALYRGRAVLNTIAVAGMILLLISPDALFGASFQLSFLCVLIIAAIGVPLGERTLQPFSAAVKNLNLVAYDFGLPPEIVQFRLDLRMIAGRLRRFVGGHFSVLMLVTPIRGTVMGCEFLLISIILQLGFTLPMAYYFHRATLVSLPANVLAVPLTEIALVTAMLAIAASYLWFGLARIPAFMAALAIHAMAGSVRWFGALRIADVRVPTPRISIMIFTGASLLLAMLFARRDWRLATIGVAALTATAFWICFVPPRPAFRPRVFELTAIDVGQGDSILVVSPEGRTLLVDAGGIPHWMHSELDIGEDVVSSYLWSRGFHQLDAVAVTHPHADHIGGMRAILANFHPRELWLGTGPSNSELKALLAEAEALGVPVIRRHAGDQFDYAGLRFHVFAPAADASGESGKTNDDSLVMSAGYRATTALLEGDAEKEIERTVAEEQPSADLLKVAHHGSATSTIPELLAAVHPRFAVISVGSRNVYGHPRREVLERLAEAQVKTYRTDLNGAVTFYLDGASVTPDLVALRQRCTQRSRVRPASADIPQ